VAGRLTVERALRALVACSALVLGLVVLPAPAGACSCAGPVGPPEVLFRGRAAEAVDQTVLGGLWAFDVTSVVRGDVEGRQVADVATGDEAACGLGVPLVAGAAYEVGGRFGDGPNGDRRLFVNLCGGSLRQLSDDPPTREALPIEGTQGSDGGPTGWGWLIVGVLAAVGAGGTLAYGIRRRGRAG
jgi:hypothetical protein